MDERRLRARLIGRTSAMRFIILLGMVSLFADMTYEGARSVTGPYLGLLGASGSVVGIVSGFGELIGYAARLLSGWLGDRTQRYWAITIAGYAINLLAVPLLALAWGWEIAAVLIVAERTGRALRSPARDAMLSHAAGHVGLGWGFGLHEAMDQTGAVVGPLLVSVVLYFQQGYRLGFAILLLPALASLGLVIAARSFFPRPRDFELAPPSLNVHRFRHIFWIYVAAMGLIGAGYVDFALIGHHLGQDAKVSAAVIPILYAVAMATDGAAAILLGPLFDRHGMLVVVATTIGAGAAPPLLFLGNSGAAFLGMILWGIGMGAQESIMRAVVSGMTVPDRRSTAFGILNGVFGISWFFGSSILGVLYDHSVLAVVVVSIALQLLAVPLLISMMNRWADR
jgi:MFS family permease